MSIIQVPFEVVQYRQWVQENFRPHLVPHAAQTAAAYATFDLFRPNACLTYAGEAPPFPPPLPPPALPPPPAPQLAEMGGGVTTPTGVTAHPPPPMLNGGAAVVMNPGKFGEVTTPTTPFVESVSTPGVVSDVDTQGFHNDEGE